MSKASEWLDQVNKAKQACPPEFVYPEVDKRLAERRAPGFIARVSHASGNLQVDVFNSCTLPPEAALEFAEWIRDTFI